MGRNTLHILETVKALTDRGVTLISSTDGIDSSTAAGRMMIGVLGSLAEYERELVRERTALKRETSRRNGTCHCPIDRRQRTAGDTANLMIGKRRATSCGALTSPKTVGPGDTVNLLSCGFTIGSLAA